MKDLNKIFLEKLKGFRNFKFSFGNDADDDWVTLCYTSFFVFIFIVVWSEYVFLGASIQKNNLNIDASSTLIDKKSLSSVIERYDQKKSKLNIFKEDFPDVVDPAL